MCQLDQKIDKENMKREADDGGTKPEPRTNFQEIASLYDGMTVFNRLLRHKSRGMSLTDGGKMVITHDGEEDWFLHTGPAGSFDANPDSGLNLPSFTITPDGGVTRVIMPRMSAVFGEGDEEISVPFSTERARTRPDYSIDFTGFPLETRLMLGRMMTKWIVESVKAGRFLKAPVRLFL